MMDGVNSDSPTLTTRFAGLSSGWASAVLGLAVAAVAGCLTVALSHSAVATGEAFNSFSDFHFYSDVVAGIHDGKWYYDLLPELFPKYNYTPFSVFNFRTPVYAYTIGLLPTPRWGSLLLCAIAWLTLFLGFLALRREGGRSLAPTGVLALACGLGWSIVDAWFESPVYLFAEQWAGVLMTLSVMCYALGVRPAAVAAGLLALFFRELTLPYILICMAFAMWERRWTELSTWIAGLLLWAGFMAYHFSQVAPRLATGGDAAAGRWIQFGGVPFVLQTSQVHFVQVHLLPWPVVGLLTPLAVLGLLAWPGPTGLRVALTVCGYLAAFAIVGQWFNAYWGLMYIPLLSLGLAWAPPALRDLFQAAFPGAAKEHA